MQTQTEEEAYATKEVKRRPFHETIVDAINNASSSDLECLMALIDATKIPKGHDEISEAWKQRTKAMCWGAHSPSVLLGLLEQKQEAEKQPEASS